MLIRLGVNQVEWDGKECKGMGCSGIHRGASLFGYTSLNRIQQCRIYWNGIE